MKKLMSDEEMDHLIEWNLGLMHAQWGNDLSHHHGDASGYPDCECLSKAQFIHDWFVIFDQIARQTPSFRAGRMSRLVCKG